MAYVPNKCPLCGANLDPGEICDCTGDALDAYLDEETEGAEDG